VRQAVNNNCVTAVKALSPVNEPVINRVPARGWRINFQDRAAYCNEPSSLITDVISGIS
jgi:hypothetical protein